MLTPWEAPSEERNCDRAALLSLFPRDRDVGDPHRSWPVLDDIMERVRCGEVLGLELDLEGLPLFGERRALAQADIVPIGLVDLSLNLDRAWDADPGSGGGVGNHADSVDQCHGTGRKPLRGRWSVGAGPRRGCRPDQGGTEDDARVQAQGRQTAGLGFYRNRPHLERVRGRRRGAAGQARGLEAGPDPAHEGRAPAPSKWAHLTSDAEFGSWVRLEDGRNLWKFEEYVGVHDPASGTELNYRGNGPIVRRPDIVAVKDDRSRDVGGARPRRGQAARPS